MCERSSKSTSLPEPSGPTDEQFVYQLTEAGLQLFAEPGAPVKGRPRRGEGGGRGRGTDRRPGTVSALQRAGAAAPVPYLRLAGAWLREVGFDIGREYEVAVGAGELTLRVQA